MLKALDKIPFGVGRRLLIDFLQGKSSKSVARNRLHLKENFGSMAYDNDELDEMIGSLLLNDMIQTTPVEGNKFWRVLQLTGKGKKEIANPSLYKRKLSFNFRETKTEITDEDRKVFDKFDDFLTRFNDEQKKTIISDKKQILCLAGAGSGKPTVLTKRIEFLVKYRHCDPRRILAITFTRKARQEMMRRLKKAGNLDSVMVETFNSFSEKILRQHNDLVYDKPVTVITYRDRIMMITKALSKINMNMAQAINVYFSDAQKRGKEEDQLANIFLNDCFFLRDYFKCRNRQMDESSFDILDAGQKESATMGLAVCNYIEAYMRKHGLRDFADQLVDTISLFEGHEELVPGFDHVLIDEYQDINSTQIKLVDTLNAGNLFCVGDPRQSIYGWRGSDIRYILNFEEKYPDCDIITLTRNYRTTEHIVELINNSIKKMKLADLESAVGGEKDIKLLKFDREAAEFEFILQKIIASEVSGNEIFVLARTNRQLNDLAQLMKERRIKHVVRSDEIRRSADAGPDEVTLATIHAIKGMEAEMVFVTGCTYANFPCRGSEHPVVDMVKVEEYDKEEEERRLFYVAMSRAKNSLYMTYSGSKPTYFITDGMLSIMEEKELDIQPKERRGDMKLSGDVVERLKSWRRALSSQQGVPAFMIMHDRTLMEVAQKKPMTFAELEQVHGFGPAKVMKYGSDILKIVNG